MIVGGKRLHPRSRVAGCAGMEVRVAVSHATHASCRLVRLPGRRLYGGPGARRRVRSRLPQRRRPKRPVGGRRSAGLIVLRISAASRGGLSTAWCAEVDGAGSPITTISSDSVDRIVWIAGAEGDNRLHGFRGDSGQPVFTGGGPGDRIPGLRHFATILAAEGRLYVAGDGEIYAFSAGP